MENWKELWNKNYRGEDDTKGLVSSVKTLSYGSRNGASYLPWAIVERIYKLQDGKFEVIKVDESIVEIDRVHIRDEIDDNGVVIPKYANSYFINIKAEWKGQVYIERYPLQDSNGKPLMNWTQNELNKSVQRGKVKAIAIVSGIGYKLFEDGDLQFVEDGKETVPEDKVENAKKILSKSKAKAVKEVSAKEGNVKEVGAKEGNVKEVSVKEDEDTLVNVTAKTDNKEEQEKPKKVVVGDGLPEDGDVPIDREDLDNEIIKRFLNGGSEIQTKIRSFLKEKGIQKISGLTETNAKELYAIVK